MIAIIVAVERGTRAIGRDGDLLHHISADLRRFKALTMGHPIIMGRRTFESFPKGPLPGRENIVLTRSAAYRPEGATIAGSVDEALAAVAGRDAFVIGGGEIYRRFLPLADVIHLTEIDADTPGADTFFPEINPAEWYVAETGDTMTDDRSGTGFRYQTLHRR